ncbi:MAG: DUF4493 domain-containing protein [Muribaculaceae bacterium]
MKKIYGIALMAAMLATGVTACSSDEPIISEGEATLHLSTTVNSDVEVRSRATVDELKESAIIWISSPAGVVRKFNGAAEIPAAGIKLMSGNYVAEVWTGDSVPASFDDRYFKGREEFTLSRGDNKSVNVTCKIANVVVAANYDATVDEVLSNYTLTVSHSQGSLEYVGNTDQRGYFMMNSRDKDLHWVLTGTLNNGDTYTREGDILEAKSATLYTLNIKCTPADTEIGGAYVTIDVDETAIDVENEIPIIPAPTIKGINFDINQEQRGEAGTFGRHSVWIQANGQLSGVTLASDYFTTLFGADVTDFDLIQMTDDALRQAIIDAGITNTIEYHDAEDVTTMKLVFASAFMDALTDGQYSIVITATDGNGKSGTATFAINVSDAPVATAACNDYDIWSMKATLGGEIIKAEAATNPVIKYRKYGTLAWTSVDATVDGNSFTATVTGLEPSTKYEYIAACDAYDSPVVETFTTDNVNQLPNSDFESWTKNGKLYWLYADGQDMFWDSGNPALQQYTSFLSGNPPTYPDSDTKHGGTYSACLNSINMVVKFAAGNMFVGEFLRTQGTNGVIGWGRTWTSRPVALKGWVKYSPATVNFESSDYPALKKGDTDNGIIYIALLDATMKSDDTSGKSYPVIINTATKQLFDKNAAQVIGYGELKFTEATAGSDLIEFEIPITYVRNDVKPSNIMVTASASIGGDYFVGGEGSKMWVDDLELVYE